jgi:phasin family protein
MSTIDLEQLAQSQKASAQVLLTLARTAFHGLEQLSALNLAASRELFNTGTTGTQQLLGVRDPQQLKDVAASLARPNVDKLMEYSRSLYDLVGQSAARSHIRAGRAVQQHPPQCSGPD